MAVTFKDIALKAGVCQPPVPPDTVAPINRISAPFYGEVPDGIQDILPAADYSLFLSSTNHNLDRQKAIVRTITERRIDGLIMCSMFVTLPCRAEHSMFVGPSLTMFDQPKCALKRIRGDDAPVLAAKTRKENSDQPKRITLHGEIVVRASSAPMPAGRDKEVMPILS